MDWLRAGQALEHVLLTAMLHQVSPRSRPSPSNGRTCDGWLLRDPVFGTGQAQMIVHLGYGPGGPRTPRRPLDRILTIEP
ncbi:hypothetical protein OG936_14695 [Streptomyces sp. NBC_00846]|uniref:hypothetical protein n=1 Tax=Streptomyces sp. NBC_00846 TaxID=2975849 RepID=UPI003865DF88|nr:hypothetical protein OG936_14695 [Streptomyces sp. NBC_00846]